MAITAIWGPPCSGKTSLSIDLAFAIAKSGKSVCLVSPEPYSEMSALLNVKLMKPKSLEAAYHASGNLKQTVYQVDGLLFLLAASYYSDAFEQDVSGAEVKTLLQELEVSFEYVIVDCPSHTFNALAAWALNRAKAVFLLTGFRSSSGLWNRAYQRAIRALEGKTIPVCLQGSGSFDYRTLNRLTELTPEVWVPYYPDADSVRQMRRTLYDTGGKAGKQYNAAIEEVYGAIKEAEHEHQFL